MPNAKEHMQLHTYGRTYIGILRYSAFVSQHFVHLYIYTVHLYSLAFIYLI